MLERFQQQQYTIRRKVFKLAGGAFHIYDSDGRVIFYSKQKAFKLREDIRIYSDETQSEELLWIQARSIIDFSAAYDVFDSTSDQKVGSFRRAGWGSMMRDHWIIFDAGETEVGEIIEDSTLLALLRRFVGSLIPQNFTAVVAGSEVCTYVQHFNPFVYKLDVRFSESANAFDRIMGIAGGILLAAIEGRQDS